MISQTTYIHPLTIILLVFAVFIIYFCDKNKIINIFLFISFLVPMQQRIVIWGLDFFIIRIIGILLFSRIVYKKEIDIFSLNKLDKLYISFVTISFLTYNINFMDLGHFIQSSGVFIDGIFLYYVFKYFTTDLESIKTVSYALIYISIILSLFMIIEKLTSRNYFSFFGGVPYFTEIRDGKLRSQGSFAHPITSGIFAATLFPYIFGFIYLVRERTKLKLLSLFGLIIVIFSSSSSTPYISFITAALSLCLYRLNNYRKYFKYLIAGSILLLTIIMKAPFYAIINRMQLFSSSSGYHRFNIIDQFINNVGEWFFFGTQDTAHWGYNLQDLANQFVRIGVDYGILSLLLFIIIILYSFKIISRAMSENRNNKDYSLFLWSLGVMLFVHVISFFGVNYFDQVYIIYIFTITLISHVLTKHKHNNKNYKYA